MRATTVSGLTLAMIAAITVGAGCGADDGGGDGSPLRVTGRVVDFETGQPVAASATISTFGLDPVPTVAIDGASFALDGVAPHSVFYVLAGAAPTHRNTYGAAIEVGDRDYGDVDVAAVSEAYLASLSAAFDVQPTASTGVLLAQVVDDAGHGRAGVAAAVFDVPAGVLGPYFLDADLAPAPTATETSASGWAVFFEVRPGVVGLLAAPDSGYTLDMPQSPVAPAAATLARLTVSDGGVVLPRDVSFSNDVIPIFESRGCQSCHSGSGPGRDLGNLTLDGSANLIHRELTEELAVAPGALRVDLANPEASLVLTMPSAEDPPDDHPNITFASALDPDYLTLLVWIREGAKQN